MSNIMKEYSINGGHAVFGIGEFTYQPVLDDFQNAKFIGIMTFNISPRADSTLLGALKSACSNGTNAIIITNIPQRYLSYYKPEYAIAAKDKIELYLNQLNPKNYGMRLNPYFTFKNHAKIIMTENIVYLGSSNFSDESSGNFECGTISSDKELIGYLKDSLFPDVQQKSVPYYKYNFAVAIANLDSLIPACKIARQHLFDAAFMPWADYDTNFEEKWIYRTTDSGVTIEFLQGFMRFFSKFEDALNVIDDIIDEYWELDELPEPVGTLKTLFEEYKSTYESFYETISSLFEDLKDLARYDVSDEACRKIVNDYGMEAYDEQLDYYAEKAMDEASNEYEELIKNSESTIRDALENLDCIISYFMELNSNLHQLLEIDPRIDNTGVSRRP